MCIQSYYNNDATEQELELDLLAEIKELGIEKWTQKVEREIEQDHDTVATTSVKSEVR